MVAGDKEEEESTDSFDTHTPIEDDSTESQLTIDTNNVVDKENYAPHYQYNKVITINVKK